MKHPYTTSHVAIIGAGYAGLSCAVALARHNIEVSLFEKDFFLGGRAKTDVINDKTLDYGYHLFFASDRVIPFLFRTLGIPAHYFDLSPLQICTNKQYLFQFSTQFYPLNLYLSCLNSHGFTLTEKWQIFRLLRKIAKSQLKFSGKALILTDWLKNEQQSEVVIQHFWRPLACHLLCCSVEHICVQTFCQILDQSVLQGGKACQVMQAKVALNELLPFEAARFLGRHRAQIYSGNEVKAIQYVNINNQPTWSLNTSQNLQLSYSHVVIASDCHHALKLLSPFREYQTFIQQAQALNFSVARIFHLGFEQAINLPLGGLNLPYADNSFAFVHMPDLSDRTTLSVTIFLSNQNHHYLNLATAAFIELICTQLALALGEELPSLLWHHAQFEPHACLSNQPAISLTHPEKHLPNLYLAGDYLHAKGQGLSNAIQSGLNSAQAIITDLKHSLDP